MFKSNHAIIVVAFATALLLSSVAVNANERAHFIDEPMPSGSQIADPDEPGLYLARESLPEVLQLALEPEDNVHSHFEATSGLTGWVIESDVDGEKEYCVYYTMGEGDEQLLFIGELLGVSGSNLKNIGMHDAKKHAPRTNDP